MAMSYTTSELRSAKEKFLCFHDLKACNRVFGARFFRTFNSSGASAPNLLFQSFRFRWNVLFHRTAASDLFLRLSDHQCLSLYRSVWRGLSVRFKSLFIISHFRDNPEDETKIPQRYHP